MPDSATNLASLLFLGFFLGMRHATDADHIIAIATIISRQRSLRGSAMIGAAWGVGHTFTILVVGGAIILFGIVIPPRLGLAMELAVGVMLVFLGIVTLTGMGQVLRGAAAPLLGTIGAGEGHSHAHTGPMSRHHHAHGDYVHRHAHGHGDHAHGHEEDRTPVAWLDLKFRKIELYQWLRPLAIGIVHGLAGSAAVALLVLTAVREPLWAMAYLLLFGIGTVGGMMLITMALSMPFAYTTGMPRLNWQLRTASGLISFAFGLFLIYQIGFADGGLFTDAPVWEPR